MKRKSASKPTANQFSQTYYQEKSLAMQSCAVLAQMIDADVGEITEHPEKFVETVDNALMFLNQNIEPFTKPIDTDAANKTLNILQGALNGD